MYDWRINRYH